MLAGYLAVIFAGATFLMAAVMMVVAIVQGLRESKNRPEIPDPLEGDPAVVSTKLPPLPPSEMNTIEQHSTKPNLAYALSVLVILAIIFGFSGYGFKEMGASSRTTAAIRKEAKQKAQRQRREEAGLGIEEEGEGPTKRRGGTFDVTTNIK